MTESGQLQPEETLVDRGVDDVLDEGYSPPDRPHGVTAKGVTPREELEGETIDERMRQEEPDPTADITYGDEAQADQESADPSDATSGAGRSGRLVAPEQARGTDLYARDVGIDGAGASAEEAAVHEIVDDEAVDEAADDPESIVHEIGEDVTDLEAPADEQAAPDATDV